jgi:hypothetical protein
LRYGLPLIVVLCVLGFYLQARARKRWGKEELIKRFSSRLTPWGVALKVLVFGSLLTLLVAIFAGPIQTDSKGTIPVGSMQVVATIDVSTSMAKEDYRNEFPDENGTVLPTELGPLGSRLDMVRKIMEEQVMPAIKGNQLGVVLFGSDAVNKIEIDDDLQKARFEFDTVNPRWIDVNQAPGDGGSDYVTGLKMALKEFAATPEPKREKVILLFTDGGMDGDGKDLPKVVQAINNAHIKVIVVGIGSEESGPIRTYNPNGTFKENLKLDGCQEKDSDGACLTKMDRASLDNIAAQFGGKPIIFKTGEKLPIDWTTKLSGTKLVHEKRHIYHSLLLMVIALILLMELRGLPMAAFRRRR